MFILILFTYINNYIPTVGKHTNLLTLINKNYKKKNHG